jgi:hypothetical protein
MEKKGKLLLVVFFLLNNRTFNYLGCNIAYFVYKIMKSDCYISTVNHLAKAVFLISFGFQHGAKAVNGCI